MPKILVVDDEERILDIMERFLTMNGFEVTKAVGGGEAIEIFDSDAKIDMMVVDIKMPKINGIAVIRKAKELGREFPVLLLTGSIDTEKYFSDLKSLNFTNENILYKPVDLPLLLEKVKKKLNMA